MSTPFYDLASLVVVPSGYKASKVYAQKPLTTDGQLTFSRASTATRVNASGLIETVASNVPRLDYLGSTCPKILLEPQRSNLAVRSSEFSNAAWSKQEMTVTADAAVAPDGTTTADKVIPTAVTGTHQITSGTLTTLTQCAFSVFAKADGYNTITVLDLSVASNGAAFNLATGTVGTIFGTATATIVPYANGWYRCTVVANTTGMRVYIPTAASNFTGDGTSGVLLWGAQVEAGAYPTSYVKTEGAAVTRLGDYSGSSFATTSANWTLFVDTDFVPYEEILNLYFQTSTGRFVSFYQSFNYFRIVGNAGAGVFAGRVMSDTAGRKKVVLQNNGTDCFVYVNGVKLGGINTSGASPLTGTGTSQFTFYGGGGTVASIGKIRQFMQFHSRLTDAQCIELSTL